MKIVIAPDSFKECLSAERVAASIAEGLRRVWPDAEYIELPMADGGEGTVSALTQSAKGYVVAHSAHDPLMRPLTAHYGIIDEGRTAVIEVASASGLPLLSSEERDPCIATSFGTGELIVAALDRGIRDFIIGIGGSVTNDGGAGIAMALGYQLLGSDEKPIQPGGLSLADLIEIKSEGVHAELKNSNFLVACDVSIPLCGPNGTSLNYSIQKGAVPGQTDALEAAMTYYGDVLNGYAGRNISDLPGAGAAGGIGAGLLAFTSSSLVPGFELIAKACGLEEHIRACDLVITGEGKIDVQTSQGKVPEGVAGIAQQHKKPVIGFCGTIDLAENNASSGSFTEIVSLEELATDTEDSMENAARYLVEGAESFARRWT